MTELEEKKNKKQKTVCPTQGGFGEEFCSNGSRAGLLIRLGCVQGLHSFNLASGGLLMNFCGSWGYQIVTFSLEWRMLYQVVNIFHLLGVLVLQKSSEILLCVSLEAEPGSCPKAALMFLVLFFFAITIFNWSTHIKKDELHEEACSKRKCVQSKMQNYSYDQIT